MVTLNSILGEINLIVIYTKTISGISDETVNHGDAMDHTDVDCNRTLFIIHYSTWCALFITPLGALASAVKAVKKLGQRSSEFID